MVNKLHTAIQIAFTCEYFDIEMLSVWTVLGLNPLIQHILQIVCCLLMLFLTLAQQHGRYFQVYLMSLLTL